MKKLYFIAAIVFILFAGLQSCSKQSPDEIISSQSAGNIVKINLAPNQTYQLTLDNSVTASVSKQAAHFQLSRTEVDAQGLLTYKYLPALDYTGTDEVVLSKTIATNGDRSGCSSGQGSSAVSYTTSFTTLKINITDK